MTETVTSGSMSGDARWSDGLLGESGHERRRSQQAPPVLIYAFLMDYYIAGLTAGATKG